jgi:predicted RNase H-like nuclease (RuvC/YqgF family)
MPGILAVTTPAAPSGDLLGSATNVFVIASVIVAILALGWAFRTRRNVVEIQNYKDLAESYEKVHNAQKAENETLQTQIAELQRARAEDEQKIRQLQAKLDALTDIVTGKTAIDDLARKTDDGFRALRNGQDQIIGRLEDLTKRGAA